jgi:hypothetical protein
VSADLGGWIRSYPARKTSGTRNLGISSIGNRDLGIPKTGKVTAAKGNLGTVERVSKASKVSKLKSTKPLPLLKPKVTFEESEINLAGTEYNVKLYGEVTANLDSTNKVSARTDNLRDLKFHVMDTFFDVIIGSPDILRHQLGHRIPRYFGATPLPSQSMSAVVPTNAGFGMCGTCPCRDTIDLVASATCNALGNTLCGPCELVDGTLNMHIDSANVAQSNLDYRTRQQQANVLASMVIPKSEFLDHIDDDDFID